MALKWVNDSVLDNGLNQIKNTATRMLLLSAYPALGTAYATVVANTLASVTLTSADFTLGGTANVNRTLTVASGKTAVATATASGTPDLHIAFTDGVANVLWVTDETSNQAVLTGNTINFPAPVYTSSQPV
jgi:hypothetical protein